MTSEKENQATSVDTAAAAAASSIPPPTWAQLRIVAVRSAIPMIGFGFMDNLVMIQAGEAIDMSLGVAFGLSTMTAAGFGQCFSDVAGLTCGGLVDATVAKLQLPHHNLSLAQMDLKVTRTCSTLGGCVGVVTGCLLGMSCLLFMDTDKADRAKKAKELQSIFESVIVEGHRLINAERATLWMIDQQDDSDSSSDDKKKSILWSRVASGVDGIIEAPMEGSIVGECVRTQQIIHIPDAYQDPRFDRNVDQQTGFRTQSVLAVPVKDDTGKIVGAIQMMNKKDEQGNHIPFGEGDIKCAQMLGSHVSCFIRVVNAG
ncbi:cAMP and cAMP-inhibited cGMP 3',5'-cyclic phosphodiesterase 10A [Seminavis robusta]|uniref:cAMP and cAMP-inhibited cGMP 3',5'-cyclic phosphodiesterase 10A n=1 Tax=Seminavis robusta TaxID=568900 RepID=A0A9N8DGT9_9STRA|nr:cAMP and cAMP-inhibited cGMP 3',5'-cyclic phosphodiesterase 10A [Seminavis robusta]|eukprot:Sro138_g064690.1 cAMP and cAMP-inhibited cGMP 3',5'-cyclic phosphodiesterase 10A (315) ;mRNA; r:35661-36776